MWLNLFHKIISDTLYYVCGVCSLALIENYLTKLGETSNNPPVVQIHYQLQFVSSDALVMLTCEVVG